MAEPAYKRFADPFYRSILDVMAALPRAPPDDRPACLKNPNPPGQAGGRDFRRGVPRNGSQRMLSKAARMKTGTTMPTGKSSMAR